MTDYTGAVYDHKNNTFRSQLCFSRGLSCMEQGTEQGMERGLARGMERHGVSLTPYQYPKYDDNVCSNHLSVPGSEKLTKLLSVGP